MGGGNLEDWVYAPFFIYKDANLKTEWVAPKLITTTNGYSLDVLFEPTTLCLY